MPETIRKTVLITGAARPIGRAVALDLAASGWAVAVQDDGSAGQAEALAAEIVSRGGGAVALPAARAGHEADLVSRAVEVLGPLGCLVNAAMACQFDSAATADRASWDRHLEANLRLPLVLSQAFAARLPEGDSGAIVTLIDPRAWTPAPDFLSFAVSQSGLWTLTRSLALALAPRVRVNAVSPGPALPEPAAPEATTLQEICGAVRFILAAPAMTGQMIALDDGRHPGWAAAAASFKE